MCYESEIKHKLYILLHYHFSDFITLLLLLFQFSYVILFLSAHLLLPHATKIRTHRFNPKSRQINLATIASDEETSHCILSQKAYRKYLWANVLQCVTRNVFVAVCFLLIWTYYLMLLFLFFGKLSKTATENSLNILLICLHCARCCSFTISSPATCVYICVCTRIFPWMLKSSKLFTRKSVTHFFLLFYCFYTSL